MTALGVALVAVLVLGLSACGAKRSSVPVTPLVVPHFSFDCNRSPAIQSERSVPIRVFDHTADDAEEVTGVCIDGQGPFTFLVDTGASTSLIDSTVAKRLHLKTSSAIQTQSFGCQRSISLAPVTRWSLSTMVLPSTTVLVGQVRSSLVPDLDGLLGSDVLARFGAVRFDFAAETLTFGHSSPAVHNVDPGDSAPTVGGEMTAGTRARVPMEVRLGRFTVPRSGLQATNVRVSVTIDHDGDKRTFAVDTGSAALVVDPATVKAWMLIRRPGSSLTSAGLSCPIKVNAYQTPNLDLGDIVLPSQTARSIGVPRGLDGLLGSGTLQHHTPVVIDYEDGELLLGT